MFKQSIYLDTTVPSAYYDARTPERQGQTRAFWQDVLPRFDACVSGLVVLEMNATPDVTKRAQLTALVSKMDVLAFNEDALRLAQEYVERGIFPEKYESDAQHVAVAVTHGIGYLCSWNFTHLVKVHTRREVNLVNSLQGYGPIEIVAPPEL